MSTMTIAQFFVQRWEAELPAFRRVLSAVPAGKLDYRPHERSTSAGDLAWQLAHEQQDLAELVEHGVAAYQKRSGTETIDEIVAMWDAATEDLRARLRDLDDSKLEKPARFTVGGKDVWTDTLGNMLWGYLLDMIHHRGQLSAYLRPMGAKVPSIYGPSGDDA